MRNILLTFYLLSSIICNAQSGLLRKETDDKGTMIFAEFRTDSVLSAMSESRQLLKQLLSTGKDDELLLVDSKTDQLGFIHHYYSQYYKGVRVAYASYSIHGKDNIANTAHGTYQKVGKVETTPKLTEKEALNFANAFVNAKRYKWEIPEEEQWLKKNYNESYYPKGELVIVKDRLKMSEKFRLTWKFDIYAHAPISRNLIYVDALTGEVVDTESKLHHVNSLGTGITRYSGTRSMTTDSFTNGFRLRETRNSVRIETYNMRNQGTNYASAPDFIDNNNNWSAAEFNNTNMDNAALDAHWGTEMVYDYFNSVHSRNSWNGSGGPLLSYVHTDLTAFGFSNNVNAFWDGQRMTYGDGNLCFQPLTAIDIVAHEIGHAVNSSSARLKYQGESGALNESLSDIWAACIEFFAAPEKQTWLAGEDIADCDVALRSMNDPSSLSYTLESTSNYPDTYNGNGFYTGSSDNGGVHINSSVSNFWFFLMVNGGTGTNDINNCYNVAGIGIGDAALIVYRAETVILASSTEQTLTFNQFRNATITAATNLFGANSPQRISVSNAWYAVGVGAANNYIISGPPLICTTGTFTLNNSPNNPSWSVTPSNLVTPSSGNGATANFTKVSNGNASITFRIGCTSLGSFSFHTGPYSSSDYPITGPSSASCGSNVYFSTPTLSGTTSINWTWPNGWTYVSGQGTTSLALKARSSGNVGVGVNNTCGPSGSYATKYVSVSGTCPASATLSVSPNPASDEITISFLAANDTTATDSKTTSNQKFESSYEIKIYDHNQELVYTAQTSLKKYTVSTANFPNGDYYLNIFNKEGIIQRKILINKKQ